MKQYQELLKTILDQGVHKKSRTGIDTLSVFAVPFKHDLKDGFPLLTTKKISWKNVLYELCWFICGQTNVGTLQKKNVHIWDEWAAWNGEVGPVYGKQWTSWWKPDGPINQLKEVIERLRKDPNDRRAIVSAWNVADIPLMKLPPCHHCFQFLIQDGRLCCFVNQRSADTALGVPYNIASYAFLTHLVARQLGIEVGELAFTFVDCHLYHVDANDPDRDKPFGTTGYMKRDHCQLKYAETIIDRDVRALPTITLKGPVDIFDFARDLLFGAKPAEEFVEIHNYDPHPAVTMAVAV